MGQPPARPRRTSLLWTTTSLWPSPSARPFTYGSAASAASDPSVAQTIVLNILGLLSRFHSPSRAPGCHRGGDRDGSRVSRRSRSGGARMSAALRASRLQGKGGNEDEADPDRI